LTNIAVKIEFEQKLYEELKQALAYFANVPVVDPQSHRFVLNPDNGQPLMIVHSPKVGEFLKLGAIKIVEDYKNPMVRQGCDNLKLQLKNLMKQTGGGGTGSGNNIPMPPKK
jgi:hypothetical protein